MIAFKKKEKYCKNCGKVFLPLIRNQTCCNNKCFPLYDEKCTNCDKKFKTSLSKHGTFCSHKCYSVNLKKILGGMHPTWSGEDAQRDSKTKWLRRNYKKPSECLSNFCSKKSHNYYYTFISDDAKRIEDVVMLCHSCKTKRGHGIEPDWNWDKINEFHKNINEFFKEWKI